MGPKLKGSHKQHFHPSIYPYKTIDAKYAIWSVCKGFDKTEIFNKNFIKNRQAKKEALRVQRLLFEVISSESQTRQQQQERKTRKKPEKKRRTNIILAFGKHHYCALLCNRPKNLVKLHQANIRGKILNGWIKCQRTNETTDRGKRTKGERKIEKWFVYCACASVCMRKSEMVEWVANIGTCHRFNENVWLSLLLPVKTCVLCKNPIYPSILTLIQAH